MIDDTIHTLQLKGMAYGGDAIGLLPDGRAVFVPYGLPAETVRVRLLEEKPHHARAELTALVEGSPQRAAPRCTHFGVCGGCHYQHIRYDAQCGIKKSILADQLQRIGKFDRPPVGEIVPSPAPWNYRSVMQFHIDHQGRLGFWDARAQAVLAVGECHLMQSLLDEVWRKITFEAGSGIERVEARCDSRGEVLLTLESSDPQSPFVELDLPVSIVHHSPAGSLVVAGDDFSWMQAHGKHFRVSAGSFFQVNPAVTEALVDHLLEKLPLHPGATILDVYAGVGLFSALIAPSVRRVIGVERSQAAVEDFAFNLDEFDNVELYAGVAETVLPALSLRPDAVVVDPPRSGLATAALDAIVRMQSPLLVYVSCDPATLARDARRLAKAGYRLESVTPFDMFPQTYHIESLSVFTLKGKGDAP